MTDTVQRIPLEEADLATLKHFAELALGIEVKAGTNASQLRGMISKTMPDLKDVPPVPAPPAPIVQATPPAPPPAPAFTIGQPADGEDPKARPAAVSLPASAELLHSSSDPKVLIEVQKTGDKSRPRDVTINVNGEVFRMQRGQKVEVPYRVYVALLNAVEKQAIDTDETNPHTGDPIKSWEDVYSYPFTVYRMPTPEAVAAWEAASGAGFANAA